MADPGEGPGGPAPPAPAYFQKYTKLFFLWATRFRKKTVNTEENYWDQLRCVKISTADLRQIALKNRGMTFLRT